MPLHHQPPKNQVGAFIWRWRQRIEATFALSMLDDWEKALVVSVVVLLLSLFYFSLYQYLPNHVSFLRRRYAYYVYGNELAPLTPEFLTHALEAARAFLAHYLDVAAVAVGGEDLKVLVQDKWLDVKIAARFWAEQTLRNRGLKVKRTAHLMKEGLAAAKETVTAAAADAAETVAAAAAHEEL